MSLKSETKSPSIFWLIAVPVIPLMRLLFKYRIEGREHIPSSGPFILAANHVTEADPVALGLALWDCGRAPHFLAKASLWEVPGLKWIMNVTKQIPVVRGGGNRNKVQEMTKALIKNQAGLIVYPEGTLTRDPDLWPMRGYAGTVRMALEGGVPIIPVAQWGSHQLLSPYSRRLRWCFRKPYRVVIGAPFDLSPYEGKTHSAKAMRGAMDAIMTQIADQLADIRGEQRPETLFDPGIERKTVERETDTPDAEGERA